MSQTKSPRQKIQLVVPRATARRWIQNEIKQGRALPSANTFLTASLTPALRSFLQWFEGVLELLDRIIDSPEIANDWRSSAGKFAESMNLQADRLRRIYAYREFRDECIGKLESLHRRLRYIPEALPTSTATLSSQVGEAKDVALQQVFIVHGHDEAAKESVARFLMQLEIKPVILAEEPSRGKAIIEKLEASDDVAFAVVLLTPDDVGAVKEHKDNLQPRARQNVVLELGYFMALLGRDYVCALYKGDVEIPSDYFGVVYIPFDDKGAWKPKLAQELNAAGVDVDLNKAYNLH
jgi:predicted nucleotide-binding protein